MENRNRKPIHLVLLLMLSLGLCSAYGQKGPSAKRGKLLDTVRLGVRYQIQEFHTLNQRLAENCNCDEGQPLSERSLQGISVSLLEPLGKRWALGADFGASFGKVMDDLRSYRRYSFVQVRFGGSYHLFGETSRLRPYLSIGAQLLANEKKALLSVPVGAGLRYRLDKGGYLNIETAYDAGFSSSLAKNMITSVGFNVPMYKRRELEQQPVRPFYVQDVRGLTADSLSVAQNAVPSAAKAPGAAVSPSGSAQVAQVGVRSPFDQGPPQLNLTVYFDVDKSSLARPETSKALSEVYAFMKKYPSSRAYLSGHTDGVRDQAYNIELSKRRVRAVANWLVSNHIDGGRISSRFYGKGVPASTDNSEIGRAINRRVEITVQ